MCKPSLLYASPFPPQESGISDYSVALTQVLREYFDITLYVAGPIADPVATQFRVLRHGVDPIPFDDFDYRFYHIGNNPWFHGYIYEAALRHPGVVLLHDLIIYYLVIGLYRDRPDFYRRLYAIGGCEAVNVVKQMTKAGVDLLQYGTPEKLSLIRELLCSGNRFIAHSEYTAERIRNEIGDSAEVCKINLLCNSGASCGLHRDSVWSRLQIPPSATVVASFGFVAPTKLNEVACRVVRRLQQEGHRNLYYVMVGQGDYVNEYLGERIKVTGYVSLEDFEQYLTACDLVINLRYPTMGETSAALVQALKGGKPCIVSDLGWFSELPNDSVLKLDVSSRELVELQLYEAIRIFLEQPRPFLKMGRAAAAYVAREHSPAKVARQMRDFLCGRTACAAEAGR